MSPLAGNGYGRGGSQHPFLPGAVCVPEGQRSGCQWPRVLRAPYAPHLTLSTDQPMVMVPVQCQQGSLFWGSVKKETLSRAKQLHGDTAGCARAWRRGGHPRLSSTPLRPPPAAHPPPPASSTQILAPFPSCLTVHI